VNGFLPSVKGGKNLVSSVYSMMDRLISAYPPIFLFIWCNHGHRGHRGAGCQGPPALDGWVRRGFDLSNLYSIDGHVSPEPIT
jgi:hypothetical protein